MPSPTPPAPKQDSERPDGATKSAAAAFIAVLGDTLKLGYHKTTKRNFPTFVGLVLYVGLGMFLVLGLTGRGEPNRMLMAAGFLIAAVVIVLALAHRMPDWAVSVLVFVALTLFGGGALVVAFPELGILAMVTKKTTPIVRGEVLFRDNQVVDGAVVRIQGAGATDITDNGEFELTVSQALADRDTLIFIVRDSGQTQIDTATRSGNGFEVRIERWTESRVLAGVVRYKGTQKPAGGLPIGVEGLPLVDSTTPSGDFKLTFNRSYVTAGSVKVRINVAGRDVVVTKPLGPPVSIEVDEPPPPPPPPAEVVRALNRAVRDSGAARVALNDKSYSAAVDLAKQSLARIEAVVRKHPTAHDTMAAVDSTLRTILNQARAGVTEAENNGTDVSAYLMSKMTQARRLDELKEPCDAIDTLRAAESRHTAYAIQFPEKTPTAAQVAAAAKGATDMKRAIQAREKGKLQSRCYDAT